MPPRVTWLPYAAVAAIALIWGMNFVLIKAVYESIPPSAVGLLRYALMVPLVFVAAFVLRQREHVPARLLPAHWFAGFLGSGLYMVLFLQGMEHVSAATGAIILATAPLWIGLFSVLRGHDPYRPRLLWGSLLAYFGVVMVVGGGDASARGSWQGIVLVALSAIVWAWSVIAMKPLLEGKKAIGVFAVTLPGAALIMLPYGWSSVASLDYVAISGWTWAGMAYLVVLAGIVAFALYYYSVQAIGPAKTGMVGYYVPVVASVGGWLIGGDRLSLVQILGIGGVLAGVIWARNTPSVAEAPPAVLETAPLADDDL